MGQNILLQLDSDSQTSSFDAVVAIDAGADHLLQYANVTLENVVSLVHGAMFTRGPQDLKHTAIFVGGSHVPTGEQLGSLIRKSFFGPIRVSVMLDGNGSNTTAAAAVLCAARHIDLAKSKAVVLGGTGPVGSRAARLLLRQGASVTLVSRNQTKADDVCRSILENFAPDFPQEKLQSAGSNDSGLLDCLASCDLALGCGAAGVQLLHEDQLSSSGIQVAIDLNAVPPAGLAGIEATDKAVSRGSRVDYGAIGVGGLKMKIHKECIRRLFLANDQFFDAEEVFQVGLELEQQRSA